LSTATDIYTHLHNMTSWHLHTYSHTQTWQFFFTLLWHKPQLKKLIYYY
jgi:hypothetical protein